jgi:hypothetical protein
MTGTRSKVVIAGFAALAIAACGSTTTTHHVAVATTQAAPPSAAPPSASALASSPPLTCDTEIDQPGTVMTVTPLDVTGMIAYVEAVFRVEFSGIMQGVLSDTAVAVLQTAYMDFNGGWTGNKLSDDVMSFQQDDHAYNPGPNPSEVYPQYTGDMLKDLTKLVADCPHAYKVSQGLPG